MWHLAKLAQHIYLLHWPLHKAPYRAHRILHLSKPDSVRRTIYVSDLAAAVKQPLPAVSRALRQLEQDGLIERITDSNDRRKTLVRPTEKGLDASRQVEAAISRYFERVICRIPEEQREQLFSLTGVLLEAVEAENAEQQAKLKGENENG